MTDGPRRDARPRAARTEAEIASQPACWRRAGRLAASVAGTAARRRGAGRGRRAAAPRGSSRSPTRRPGRRPGRARPTRSPPRRCRAGGDYDRVLVLSRSGTTTEILQLLTGCAAPSHRRDHRGRADPGGGRPPTTSSTLAFADEESVVQTRFATTELALLRAHLGHDIGPAARRGGAGARRAAAGGAAGRPPVHLPRHRLDLRPGQRGRAQAARGGRHVDRVLPGHGVPARPGRGDRRRQRRVGCSAPRPTGSPTRSRRPAARPGQAARTRWPSWSGCSGSPSRWPGRAGLDPDRPRNLTRSVILAPATG